jgi:hypothetical protein
VDTRAAVVPKGAEQPAKQVVVGRLWRAGRAVAHGIFLPKSPFEQSHYLRPSQRIKMQIEADERRRRFSLNVEFVGLHREDSEQIAMRMVALRRTWTARSVSANPWAGA